ncbi:hypothetical protein CERSUDRAFT_149704 [Gelatoporia subvermispora B]|uniref:Urease accessory protein UreF n=1 Tax=Ceriporiopsis subvermispora (strain B) TaxID=914234 RepID=M2RRJ6_CERS8|nr:hypothetical protein CERSUDRAFT_149704 [Gelatoporia subvermispora B]
MDSDYEAYILLLLSDGNLPTGSFVASSGLESYVTHGFFGASSSTSQPKDKLSATTNFIRDSLATYARSALPFVYDAHKLAEDFLSEYMHGVAVNRGEDMESAEADFTALDNLYEAMTLNDVVRRASKAQGVALLTLFSKGFSKPPALRAFTTDLNAARREELATKLVDHLKLQIRRERILGHLPTCWGVLTAALNLSLERSQFLHLFLHARNLLSASVRLNTLGPYAAQQLLLHAVRPLVEIEMQNCKHLRSGYLRPSLGNAEPLPLDGLDETLHGPANTWPLGEILAARHDLQHSRIFNS